MHEYLYNVVYSIGKYIFFPFFILLIQRTNFGKKFQNFVMIIVTIQFLTIPTKATLSGKTD